MIRFSSIASQIIGPALSDFEMSFRGRSWPKIAQEAAAGQRHGCAPNVTPLANQLVSTSDSVLGPVLQPGRVALRGLGPRRPRPDAPVYA